MCWIAVSYLIIITICTNSGIVICGPNLWGRRYSSPHLKAVSGAEQLLSDVRAGERTPNRPRTDVLSRARNSWGCRLTQLPGDSHAMVGWAW